MEALICEKGHRIGISALRNAENNAIRLQCFECRKRVDAESIADAREIWFDYPDDGAPDARS